jgi:hypothetical protein
MEDSVAKTKAAAVINFCSIAFAILPRSGLSVVSNSTRSRTIEMVVDLFEIFYKVLLLDISLVIFQY